MDLADILGSGRAVEEKSELTGDAKLIAALVDVVQNQEAMQEGINTLTEVVLQQKKQIEALEMEIRWLKIASQPTKIKSPIILNGGVH